MKPFKNPPPPAIGPESAADVITNLHEALFFLVEIKRLELTDAEQGALLADQILQKYRDGTSYSVIAFQQQYGLPPNKAVDETTANALNNLLEEMGAFENLVHGFGHVVSGQVRQEDGQIPERTLVRAF
ncbi:MAG TPA: hypothetical protein VIT23_03040, partial [Terrimicrobiaceae bacterium]